MPDTKDNAGLDEKEFSRNNKENFRLTGEEKKKKQQQQKQGCKEIQSIRHTQTRVWGRLLDRNRAFS